ncbi:MAG: pilin [Candidatus Pacebacteria bacterium]|nr:pilin [Candidatus Paceibacterota bacterium]
MPKKFIYFFALLLFLSVFVFPVSCLAKNNYQIKDGPIVEYEGFVPCGKCVCPATGPVPTDNLPDTIVDNTKKFCATAPTAACPNAEVFLPCQLCHFFVMADNTIDYLMVDIIPILAVLMLVIGGVMFYFSGTNPGLMARAKTLLKSIVIGLFLIYGAYMVVNYFLVIVGAAKVNPVTSVFQNGVFSIKCPIEIPKK